jgi:hypothetical protein
MNRDFKGSDSDILSFVSAWETNVTDSRQIPAPVLTQVLVDNRYEVRRWCQRLVCTEAQLRAAVAKVGDSPSAVRAAIIDQR